VTIAKALRRAVPFFVRRGVVVVGGEAAFATAAELAEAHEAPSYTVMLTTEPGGARAMFIVDGPAIAYLLEGSLGGDGTMLPELDPEGLSPAQRAVITRVAELMVTTMSEGMDRAIGVGLVSLPAGPEATATGGPMVALTLTLTEVDEETGEEQAHGNVTLAISQHALSAVHSRPADRAREPDQRLVKTLEQTEVEVVAELGRMQISLGQLAALEIGSTLRLAVPVKGAIAVRVDQRVLFKAQPTAVGTQLAVRLTSRWEDSPQKMESDSNVA